MTAFMKHIQFCIFTGRESGEIKSDIPDMRSEYIHLTIIPH